MCGDARVFAQGAPSTHAFTAQAPVDGKLTNRVAGTKRCFGRRASDRSLSPLFTEDFNAAPVTIR
jgi:hypothetical protein